MTARIAIVGGGGGVGASLAFNLLLRDEPYEIALVDGRSGMARSHEMDLQQVLAAGATGSIRIVELAEAAEAEVVVVSASVPLTVNTSRMVYLRDNAEILAQVGRALPRDWPGVALVVTNPVDPLCTWLQRATGLDRRRVLGYTANDSLRLQTAVGEQLGVAAGRRRRLGGRRARRRLRAAARPRARERRAGDARAGAAGGRRAVRAQLVRAPRRARLRPLLDLDLGARPGAHGGRADRPGRGPVAGLDRARGRVRRQRRRAHRARDARARRRARLHEWELSLGQLRELRDAGESVRVATASL